MLPWAMPVYVEAFVPAVRYVILAFTVATVVITEGAAGPVSMIMFLFVIFGLITSSGCWLLAYLIARLLNSFPLLVQRCITFACLGIALLFALIFKPYITPFGRALTGGLLEVLS